MFSAFTGRKLAAFDSAEEAKAWLVKQAASEGGPEGPAAPHRPWRARFPRAT